MGWRRTLGPVALAAALAVGCSSADAPDEVAAAPAGPATGALSGVCPDRVVVQAAWYPTADTAVPFQLLGPDWKIDAERKRVSGSLVDGGEDTGVDLEFRSGGPATGFQTAPAVAYQDKSVTLALTNVDEIIGLTPKQPMTAVMAPLNGDPQVLIWDPATYPDFNIVQDVGQTDTKVVYSGNARTVFGYLSGSGILRPSQLDGSYDGSPSRFIAAGGKDVVQGYATNEPYVYENIPAWHKPVKYGLIQDTGYPNYANVLAVRTGDKARLAGCLSKLVPVLQRGLLAFMSDPRPALGKIVKAVGEFKAGFVYDDSAAVYGVCQLRTLGLVSNTIEGVAGGYDGTKLQRMIEITRPVLATTGVRVSEDLRPADIATAEYLDRTISLPTPPRLTGVRCPTGASQ